MASSFVVRCRRSFFFFPSWSVFYLNFLFTCLSPGTSVTGLPSALIHRISGRGLPVAAHSTTVPVVLEKSMRLVGSFKKTGPDREDELAAAVAEPSPTHAPINHKKRTISYYYGHQNIIIRRFPSLNDKYLFKFWLFLMTENGHHGKWQPCPVFLCLSKIKILI